MSSKCLEHDENIVGLCFDYACCKQPLYCYYCKEEGIH